MINAVAIATAVAAVVERERGERPPVIIVVVGTGSRTGGFANSVANEARVDG